MYEREPLLFSQAVYRREVLRNLCPTSSIKPTTHCSTSGAGFNMPFRSHVSMQRPLFAAVRPESRMQQPGSKPQRDCPPIFRMRDTAMCKPWQHHVNQNLRLCHVRARAQCRSNYTTKVWVTKVDDANKKAQNFAGTIH
mgnify:CR=1 FL=1